MKRGIGIEGRKRKGKGGRRRREEEKDREREEDILKRVYAAAAGRSGLKS